MGSSLRTSLIALVVSLLTATAAFCENWKYRVTPYLWLPSLVTALGVGPNPPVEGTKSLLEILDGAFLIAGEAQSQDWAVIGELNYLSLSDDFGVAPGDPIAEWRLRGTMMTLAGAYAFHHSAGTRLEAMAGVRRWDLEASTTVLNASASIERSWSDPIVGLRVSTPIGQNARFKGMANIGGFGAGSENQFEVVGQVEWPVSDQMSLSVGYRHLYLDFNDGALIDVELSGPLVSLSFNF